MSRSSVLNYHHAELLFQVLRSRTLTDAAQALHISQPAVTKQIKSLEEDLGVQLFQKEGRRLAPTVEALLLADEVERTRASLTSLNELAARLKSGVVGKLVVCAIPALAQALLPGTIAEFRRTHPSIHVEVKVENSWRILDLAEAQQIDFGLCYPYRDTRLVEATTLMTSGIVCAVLAGDPIAASEQLALDALRGRPLVMVEVFGANAEIRNALARCRLDRDVICQVSASTLACEIVLRTGAVALVDSLTAASYRTRGIAVVDLPDLPRRTLSLLRPKMRSTSVFAEAFLRALTHEASGFESVEGQA
ncbi:MAG TPA: LysR substrate-binding domain-containing protein [Paraburkholderia sp.]|uniref:LysR family transcriptional regulator n=1 Tax=Paraburkholderia sp. TaxID=1926495 RepID=UPI002ED30840